MNKRPNLNLDELKNLQYLTNQLAKDVAYAVFETQVNGDEEAFVSSCCKKVIPMEEAILNHGLCEAHMDEGSE